MPVTRGTVALLFVLVDKGNKMVLSIECVVDVQVSSDETDCLMVSNDDCTAVAEIGPDLGAGGAMLGERSQESQRWVCQLVNYGKQGVGKKNPNR